MMYFLLFTAKVTFVGLLRMIVPWHFHFLEWKWAAGPPIGSYSVYIEVHSLTPFITTQLECWYSFYHPRKGRSRVDMVGWLQTEMVYLSTDSHLSSNRAWCRVSSLIETNISPLMPNHHQVFVRFFVFYTKNNFHFFQCVRCFTISAF